MIGFPGFGLEFTINPVIFKLGWFEPRWYGLIIAVGFLAAVFYCLHNSKDFGILADDMIDMLFGAVIAGIIGARFAYVVFNWSEFSSDIPAIFFIRNGVISVEGLAIYGGILFAVIACAIFCRIRKNSLGAMLDLGAYGLLIGQAIGRWGNFVNKEVYGTVTTLPWRMKVNGAEVHPLFLYESLWNALGFVLLVLFRKKRKYNGQLFTLYVAWYGLGRGLMEGLRNPIFVLKAGEVPAMQVFAFSTCLIALTIFILMTFFVKKEKEDLLAWTAVRDEYIAGKKAKKAAKRGEIVEGVVPSQEDPSSEEGAPVNENDAFFEDDGDGGEVGEDGGSEPAEPSQDEFFEADDETDEEGDLDVGSSQSEE